MSPPNLGNRPFSVPGVAIVVQADGCHRPPVHGTWPGISTTALLNSGFQILDSDLPAPQLSRCSTRAAGSIPSFSLPEEARLRAESLRYEETWS
jgi:hypothetical protein